MKLIGDLIMFFRWARNGWEVHPGIGAEEFRGWI
jgi:hypothetical protein